MKKPSAIITAFFAAALLTASYAGAEDQAGSDPSTPSASATEVTKAPAEAAPGAGQTEQAAPQTESAPSMGSKVTSFFQGVWQGFVSMLERHAGHNQMENTPNPEGKIAGFLWGVWHGVTCAITFVLSLFVGSVHFYEVYNNGPLYNFGFLLGAGAFFGFVGMKFGFSLARAAKA